MALLLSFFLLSIIFSFLCSIWEAVLLSITPSYMSTIKNSNPSLAAKVGKIKGDIDRPLSAILTLNTIAHTVGAIGVGAQAGVVFADRDFEILGIGLSMESLIAGLMTLAILILSEIIPKTLGANYWKALTPFTIKSLQVLLFILFPFVWLSQLITKRMKKDKGRSVLSRSDFSALAFNVADSGVLRDQESKTIQNVLRMEKLSVEDIMTPRTVMRMAQSDRSLKEYYAAHPKLAYSRIPIFDEKEDDITGMILKDELLQCLLEGKEELALKDIARPILSVQRSLTLDQLLETMTADGHQIAVVRDQYGSLVGVVSLEDLFETIHGLEIMDETDKVDDLQKAARSIYEKREAKRKDL